MVKRPSGFSKAVLLASFTIFFVLGCVLGLSLCLVQTPQEKAAELAQAGQLYFDKAQDMELQTESSQYLLAMSRQALVDALSLNIYDAENWMLLSSILESEGKISQSIAARDVVASLDSELARRKPKYRTLPALQLQLTQLNTRDIGDDF